MSGKTTKELNKAPKGASTENNLPMNSFEEFIMKLAENWKIIIGLGVFLIAVVLLFIVFVHVNDTLGAKSRAAFANSTTEEELGAILGEYPDHELAPAARLRLAAQYAVKKEYVKAAEEYSNVASSEKTDLFTRTKAAIDAATMFEHAERYDDGAAVLANVTANPNVVPNQLAEALYLSARLEFRKGNKEAAIAALDKLDATQRNIWRDLGTTLRRQINAQK